MQLTSNAVTTLQVRYLLKDTKGEIIETPEQLFIRVAKHVASVEQNDLQDTWYDKFFNRMSNLDFLPNTPTLMNAGKENGQLSACYVLPIEDSMGGIFRTLRDAAIIHKTGGGTGFDFSRLRPEGAMVSNKSGVSTGPLAFCQVYDKATEVVKQGASRRGANMMNLRVDHPDILKFIDMKLEPGVMTNFNVSVTITDEFMEALENDGDYQLTHPATGPVERLRARDVWERISANAHQSAEPGIIFIDRVNDKSPYGERIEATNPCGEQPLPPYGSCNLGSINLSNFVHEEGLDWEALEECVRDSTRFLDNVIDANCYPTQELHDHAQFYRNIGLGVMGWADALIKLKIAYGSTESTILGERVQEFINTVAHEHSYQLAWEKGLPEGAPFKTFYDYDSEFRRNATLTTVAPTGTLCIIAGCSSGIEPNFAFEYEKHVMDRVLTEYHPLYNAAKNNGGISADIFIDAHQVTPSEHVAMQAAFQRNCDSAISKTVNLPSTATVEDVQEAYWTAWTSGCKGVTIYRDKSRKGVLHKKDEPKGVFEDYCPECGTELAMQEGCMNCPQCAFSKCLIS